MQQNSVDTCIANSHNTTQQPVHHQTYWNCGIRIISSRVHSYNSSIERGRCDHRALALRRPFLNWACILSEMNNCLRPHFSSEVWICTKIQVPTDALSEVLIYQMKQNEAIPLSHRFWLIGNPGSSCWKKVDFYKVDNLRRRNFTCDPINLLWFIIPPSESWLQQIFRLM